jgi:hypothetical protein
MTAILGSQSWQGISGIVATVALVVQTWLTIWAARRAPAAPARAMPAGKAVEPP